MRVLRVSHSAVVTAWRGRERRLRELGEDIHLVSALSWNEGGVDVPLVPESGETITGARTFGRHPALFVYDPRPLWRLLGERWDLIDLHEEPFALATAEIRLLARLRRQRAPYLLYSAQNLRKRYPVPFRWLERSALRGAAGINACNADAAAICVDKGFPGRPAVLGLGVDLESFTARDDHVARGADETVMVGYAGRLERHKGVHVLLAALAQDPRLALRVAGDGPERASLTAEAARLGVDSRVTWLGALDQVALADFYRGLDVLAVPSQTTPSWVEQFGRVVVEAMASGTPVVASDSGALPEVARPAGVLVPETDVDAWARALTDVATQPDTWARLHEAGLERAQAFTWTTVGDEQRALYHRSVRAADPRPHPLDIVVVAYRSAAALRRTLEPLRSEHLTVVDNSADSDVRAVCHDLDVRYVDSGRNGGFSYGVNIGLSLRRPGADVLLLNPDAEISVADVGRLHTALRADPDLASVGPAQVTPDGSPSRVSWPFPTPGRTWLEAAGLGRWQRPAYVIGSVLLLRSEAIDQVGPFDESFFLYAEETDWARRATLLGWRHQEVPDATAVHVGAGTHESSERREAYFFAGQERYLRKHSGPMGWQVARSANIAGAAVRSVILSGARAQAARARLRTFTRGPLATEARFRDE